MDEVRFIDTTLRDGHQSLWAEGMRTGMILPIASQMDKAGFEAIEILSSSFFKKAASEFCEDVWERIRLVRDCITKTPLRAIRGRTMSGFEITPATVEKLWLQRLAANGIRELRTSDPSNTVANWREMVLAARKVGLETIINLIFSVSPKHTDDYYAEKAREAAKLDVHSICLKDPGGLLTPTRTETLVPAILKNAGNTPVELHTHCVTGLGPVCCVEAIKRGIRLINTAIPPLANGSSNPSLFNVAMNARALGYRTLIDETMLKPVQDHFMVIAKQEQLPIGRLQDYDCTHIIHQVPGGMISNFRHQLSILGMEHRLEEVLEEVGRVRAEFGYPIMVTPYSQFVGVQATINVILGERYKEVADEVIKYAIGIWGEEESSSMDLNVRDKILSRSRAKELASCKAPETSIQELREKLGGPGVSDDELLLRYFAGNNAVDAMKAAGLPKQYPSARPLVKFIEELTKRNGCRQIYIHQQDLSIRLEKKRISSS